MNEWQDNHGEMPKGITDNTYLDVEYRDGVVVDNTNGWNFEPYWDIRNQHTDIIRWRFA